MSDVPENLHLTRKELDSPTASENIKERLNLHVKRRLQQEPRAALTESSVIASTAGAVVEPKSSGSMERPSASLRELPKQRRPYQRRTEKPAPTEGLPAGAAAVRKYTKRQPKLKQVSPSASTTAVGHASASNMSKIQPNYKEPTIAKTATYLSECRCADDEDQPEAAAGNEGEGKTGSCNGSASRDKDKCPDLLAMVLSAKRRALMEDPEVQSFLRNIIGAMHK